MEFLEYLGKLTDGRKFDGSKLKLYRETAMERSQEWLARKLGVSVKTVYRWEKGKAFPSNLALGRMKEFFCPQEVS